MELQQLVTVISERPSTLFLGAGFSMDAGGPGGYRLLAELIHNFGEQEDNEIFFNYLEDLIGINNDKRKEVETFIKKMLWRLKSNDNQKYLFSIPWKAILTTNYDRIPDDIETSLDKNREIMCVVDENLDGIYIERDDKLYCFKLFGDIEKQYPNEGYMILTRSDRRHAITRITTFYNLYKDLAMSGNIIYLGYSFKDELVFDLLADLQYSIKQFPWKGFAIMPSEPSKEVKKKLTKYDITWVQGDISSFVKELKKAYTNIPTSYVVDDKTLIFKDNISIKISKQTQINCRNHLKFFHSELIEPLSDNPKYFFEGKDHTFYPFYKNWDLRRNIKYELITKNLDRFSIDSSFFVLDRQSKSSFIDNVKIALLGNAGSGKTVVAKRIAYEWYDKGYPVIFIEPRGYRLDRKVIEGYIEEVNLNLEKRLSEIKYFRPIRFLLIADNKSIYIDELFNMFDYLTSKEILIDLLVVDRHSNLPQEKLDELEFDAIYTIDDSLNPDDLELFLKHFKKIKLDIPDEIFKRNLEDKRINESFFALMYSTIREVQIPLKDIIIDEYDSLSIDEKKIYSMVSLFHSLDMQLHVNLISKYTNISINWILNQLKDKRLSGIILMDNENNMLSNHKIISEIIDNHEFFNSTRYFEILHQIVDSFTIGNRTEEELIHNILINKIQREKYDLRLTTKKIIDLFENALLKLKTRLLYHHLARNYLKDKNYEDAISSIKKAYTTRHRYFYEPEKNLMDTEGRIELLKAELLMDENADLEIIWNHLERAENLFFTAESEVRISPHPVQGMALTYYLMARASDDYNLKYNFCLLGLSRLNYLNKNVEQSIQYSYKVEKNILSELGDGFDVYGAERILELHNNPNGYAFLAENELKKINHREANRLVDIGLKHSPTIWLLRLKIQVLNKLYPNDVKRLDDYLGKYLQIGIYDLTLAFELAKYYFKIEDYHRSFLTFDELNKRSEGHSGGYIFSPDNVLYVGNEVKSFRGKLIEYPRLNKDGKIYCNQLSEYFEYIKVKYDSIQSSNIKEEDRIYFNIFFIFSGPQAFNVTPT